MSFSEYTGRDLADMHKAEIRRIRQQNPKARIYDFGFKLRVTNDAIGLWTYYRTSQDGGAQEHAIAQRL